MLLSAPVKVYITNLLCRHFATTASADFKQIGGGSINECYRVRLGRHSAFCKLNAASKFPQLFLTEQDGLQRLSATGKVCTPAIIGCTAVHDTQILLLQWIEEGPKTIAFWTRFGEELAALHACSADAFGLALDNYMGRVPQPNGLHQDWPSFFALQRLLPLARLCHQQAQLSAGDVQQIEQVCGALPEIFAPEPPSLLHGDLWSGNFLCNTAGQPVLIDPATYYGHRSVDLAMTDLFGGFHPAFYAAYQQRFPLSENYKTQWAACQLYPLLVHLHLFGSSYRPPIRQRLQQLLH